MSPTRIFIICNSSMCVFCQRLTPFKRRLLKSCGSKSCGTQIIRKCCRHHARVTKTPSSPMLVQPVTSWQAMGHLSGFQAPASFHTSFPLALPSAADERLSREPVQSTSAATVEPTEIARPSPSALSSWTEWLSPAASAFQIFAKFKTRNQGDASSPISTTGTTTASKSAVPAVPRPTNVIKTTISKASLENRTRFLVRSVALASSNMGHHLQVEELCSFLRKYPDAPSLAAKAGAVRQLLLTKQVTKDPMVLEGLEEALVLLGYCKPPVGWGVRILSIDGGGLRGIMALEILQQLEELTGRPVHQIFDYICGVSTGAILAVLLGALKSTITQCEALYKDIGTEIFQRNPIWGTGKLVLSHAFYDTNNWTKLLQTHVGEQILVETARDDECPKIAAISTVVNRPRLEPFLFRNYGYPRHVRSVYPGTHEAHLWEAIRASAAAPGYFEEFKLGNDIHQDGGLLVNNPAALALHECKHLWPDETLQCVVSIGSGRYEPPVTAGSAAYTGLKNKLLKIVDSATDTEGVHTVLHDLLPPTVYFRFNPYLSENISLDETREEKIRQLQNDARMYLRRNEPKLRTAAGLLAQPRTRLQHIKDFVSLKKATFFQ